MLARKLKLTLNGLEVGTTPMLVPSISSRINIDISKTLETISETVYGPILISAYDYYWNSKLKRPKLNLMFPELIFLDSGGYECNKEKDVDIGLYKPDPHKWEMEYYCEVMKEKWVSAIPTVLISFDKPSLRDPIDKQIERAKDLFKNKDKFLKEILIKPITENASRINSEDVIKNLKSLSSFDILGFTEKELGYSLLKKMTTIAEIRKAMDAEGMEKPIHIFGSLDPITTPLYYISGADIFDGLSWLRFIFYNGDTYYIDSFGPKCFGIHSHSNKIWSMILANNYNYLMGLQLNLDRFRSSRDFKILGKYADFFESAYEDLKVKIEGDSYGR